MLQRNFGFPDLRYLGGGAASSVGDTNTRNGWSIANRIAFGSGTSYPGGYRETALKRSISEGGQIGSTFRTFGIANTSGSISGVGMIQGSSIGLATVNPFTIIAGKVIGGVSDGMAMVASFTLRGMGYISAIVNIGFKPSAYDIAQEVWGAIASLNNVIGTMGEKLNAGTGGGGSGVSDWSSIEKAQIRHRLGIDGTKDIPFSSNPNLGIPSLSEIADAVWDELLSGHGIAGSAGAILRVLTSTSIASAVRSELATELGRIDAAITSRLASGSYSSPPNPSTIATQVRTELAPELGRIDVILSTRATQSSMDTKPSLSQIEGSNILAKEATVNSRASQTSVNSIPTSPLLSTDNRLNFLDVSISSRLASSAYVPPETASNIALAVWNATTRSLNVDVALSNTSIAAISTAIQAGIINEGDGQQVVNAIVQAIGNINVPASVIAEAVRSNLATELARIDVSLSSRSSQDSVNQIPTNYSPAPTPTEIANAILDASVNSHTLAGSVGSFLQNILNFAKNAFVIGASK